MMHTALQFCACEGLVIVTMQQRIACDLYLSAAGMNCCFCWTPKSVCLTQLASFKSILPPQPASF